MKKTREIVHQWQPTNTTCVQTCIAMLMGKPVKKVIKSVFHGNATPMYMRDALFLLNCEGMTNANDCKFVTKRRHTRFPALALARVVHVSYDSPMGHAVVIREGMIYDPYYGIYPLKDLSKHDFRIERYIKVT